MESRFVWDVARFLNPSTTERKVPSGGPSPEKDRRLVDLSLDLIRPNSDQPRQYFDEDELEELAQSIRSMGLIQPVVVRPRGEGVFELIAGERRLRACERAGMKTIPAVVMEADEVMAQVLALVENLQRSDLSAVEEARSFSAIMERTGWSQTELARRLGRSQGAIANKLRLLHLPAPVLDLVLSGKLSERHARVLLSLSEEDQRTNWAQKAVSDGMTVRELEKAVGALLKPPGKESRKRTRCPLTSLPDRGRDEGPSPFSDGEELFLQALARLIERERAAGTTIQWKVREEGQKERVVEIHIALPHHGPRADERS